MQVVVFDLDDTLFPEERFVMSGFHAVSDWLEREQRMNGFFPLAEQIFHDGERKSVFDCVLQQLGFPYDDTLIDTLVKVYREHYPDIELFADAQWAIDYTRKHARTAIITDGYLVMQRNKVKALALESMFELIVYSDVFGREGWKPSPLPYQEVMNSLNVIGEKCIYIGDNPAKDFVTARKLGWKTVRVVRNNGVYCDLKSDEEHEADHIISDLWQLERILTKE